MLNHSKHIKYGGLPEEEASKLLVMVHGRGATAASIMSLADHLAVEDFRLAAPQANQNSWYPYSFLMPPIQNEPGLSSGLALIDSIVQDGLAAGFTSQQIYFTGFSQGACLVSEYVARHAKPYGGLMAFSGGLIGDQIEWDRYSGKLDGTPIFIGCSDRDFHIPLERIKESTKVFKSLGAEVIEKIYPNMGHTIIDHEIEEANRILKP